MDKKISLLVKNNLVLTPTAVASATVLATVVSGDMQYLFFAGLLVVVGLINRALKSLTKSMSMFKNTGPRPSTCGTNTGIDCVGCGAFPGREAKESWGMPSGHAQTTAFAATYWTIYVIKKYNKDKKDGKKASKGQMYGSIAAMWLLAIAVWIQRIYSKCHSLLQVIIGALIGVGLGFLGYYASSKIFSQLPN